MRLIFGVLSLLVVVAIVGMLARKQLQSVSSTRPAEAAAAGVQVPAASGTPAQQSRQLQQAVREDVNKLMQQAPARGEPTQ
ncbi:MAG: hypothetical protein OEY03_14620 [Rhizobacter sp.]|nr:hypothetical protein [Rhizobacter sp.]